MNHIIPTNTKKQKLAAKHIQLCAKKLLTSAAGERRPYVKYCYLRENCLYMTDGITLARFCLEFDAPGSGFFQIATIGQDLWLMDQDINSEYPETEDLFQAEIELCLFGKDASLIMKYCAILHAMSTPERIACFDYEAFKLIPENFRVYSSANPQTIEASRVPVVFQAENFQAVIMPIICQ